VILSIEEIYTKFCVIFQIVAKIMLLILWIYLKIELNLYIILKLHFSWEATKYLLSEDWNHKKTSENSERIEDGMRAWD
jgi:hypothetical protein